MTVTIADLAGAHTGGMDEIDPAARPRRRTFTAAEKLGYLDAYEALAKMRKLAAGTDQLADVDALIVGLRETHRRRPRLQQEFDQARLP